MLFHEAGADRNRDLASPLEWRGTLIDWRGLNPPPPPCASCRYHSTKIFVKAVQLLGIRKQPKWAWIRPIRKHGVTMDRRVFVQYATSDRAVLKLLCDAVHRAVDGLTVKQASNHVTLYASVVTGVLAEAASEDTVVVLAPFLVSGIKSANLELRATSYMLVAQLSAANSLEPGMTKGLFDAIGCNLHEQLVGEALKCLTVLCQTQELEQFPAKAFRFVAKVADLPAHLALLTAEFDAATFNELFIDALVGAVDKHANYFGSLVEILEQVRLPSQLVEEVGAKIVGRYRRATCEPAADGIVTTAASQAKVKGQTQQVVQIIDRQYPEAIHSVVGELLSKASGNGGKAGAAAATTGETASELLQLALGKGIRHQSVGNLNTTLFLALQHVDAAVRALAVKQLGVTLTPELELEGRDAEFLTECLAARLADVDDEVVRAVLGLGSRLMGFVTADSVIVTLSTKLAGTPEAACPPKLAAKICGFLANQVFLDTPGSVSAIINTVLPAMVATEFPKTAKLVLEAVGGSALAQDGLLRGVAKVAESETWVELRKGCKPAAAAAANRLLFGHIAASLASDIATSWDSCDALIAGLMQRSLDKPDADDGPILQCVLMILSEALCKTKNFDLGLGLVQRSAAVSRTAVAGIGPVPTGHVVDIAFDSDARPARCPVQMYTALARICGTPGLGVGITVQQIVRHVGHLMAACVLPSAKQREPFEQMLPTLFAVMFATGATVHSAGNLLQLFFSRLATVHPLEFLRGVWHDCSSNMSDNAWVRSLEIAGTIFKSQPGGSVDADTTELLLSLTPALLVLAADNAKPVRVAALAAGTELADAMRRVTSGNKKSQTALTQAAAFWAAVQPYEKDLRGDVDFLQILLARLLLDKDAAFAKPVLDSLCQAVFGAGSAAFQLRLDGVLAQTESLTKFKRYWPAFEAIAATDIGKTLSDLDFSVVKSAIRGISAESASLFKSTDAGAGGKYVDGMTTVLKTVLEIGDTAVPAVTPAGLLLDHIATLDCLSAFSYPVRAELFRCICDIYSGSSGAGFGAALRGALAALPIEAELILEIMQSRMYAVDVNPAMKVVRNSKRRKVDGDDEPGGSDSEVTVQSLVNTEVILDVLFFKGFSTIKAPESLVSPLFDLLGLCNNLESSKQVLIEHIKQMVLDALGNICSSVPTANLKEDRFDIEAVVLCIKSSSNPQTHQHALLFLAQLAPIFPQCVLQSIMPIFTFMGTNVMKHDDNYSFHVVERTIDTIIPALVKDNKATKSAKKQQEKSSVVVALTGVFVDALHHIPKHRCLPLFAHLLETLGAEEHLHVVCALLLKTVVIGTQGNQDVIDESDTPLAFPLQLRGEFPAIAQLSCLQQLLELVVPMAASGTVKQTAPSKLLFDLKEHTAKQNRHFQFLVLSFISASLSAKTFLAAMAQLDETADAMSVSKDLCLGMIQRALTGATGISKIGSGETNSATKFWKAAAEKFYDVVDKTNSLLSVPDFVQVVATLLHQDDIVIRRKALMLFTDRVSNDEAPDGDDIEAYMGLVGDLKEIAALSSSIPGAKEGKIDVVFCQTSLYALSSLMTNFGDTHAEAFEGVLDIVAAVLKKGDGYHELQANASVCLGAYSMMEGMRMIKHLPTIMPVLLGAFQKTVNAAVDVEGQADEDMDLLLQSMCATLDIIVDTLPQFLAPYLKETLLVLSHPCFDETHPSAASRTGTLDQVDSIRTAVATAPNARVLLPAVFAAYNTLITTEPERSARSVGLLASVIGRTIEAMGRDDLKTNSKQVFKFFLIALDYRTKLTANGEHEADELVERAEQSVIDAFSKLVLRLSETTFKPMLWKLIDWAGQSKSAGCRVHVLHRLIDALASELKSLFVPYFGYLMKSCLTVLTSKGGDGIGAPTLTYTTMALQKCFRFDDASFVTPDRFDALCPALTALVGALSGEADGDYLDRIVEVTAPCIAQFAVASKTHLLWKRINDELMRFCQHKTAAVRKGILIVLEEIYKVLGNEFINLLPDTVPHLLELMEDDAAEVEVQARRFVKIVEGYLGEPLADYFN